MPSPDFRLVEAAAAIGQRWAWPGLERVVIDGKKVNAETVIVEVLRAADSFGFLADSTTPPQESAVDVEAAARLLAGYHVRYEDPPYGWGWQGVLGSLDHAYEAALKAARSQPRRDQIEAAYALLSREVRRGASTDTP